MRRTSRYTYGGTGTYMMARVALRLGGAAGVAGAAAMGCSLLDSGGPASAWLYGTAVMPLARLLDAETAHHLAVAAARLRLTPSQHHADPAILRTKLWGRTLPNPLGLAAGFDKDGEAVGGLLRLGFALVEVGSVTPLPQEGNARPRVFRLEADRGVINRYGFNSAGHAACAAHLEGCAHARESLPGRLVGVNLGKNKLSADAAADYAAGVRELGRYADYLVVNVSSPNTPGLRALQGKDELRQLLRAVRAAVDTLPQPPPPLVLKIAPDLSEAERADIASVALAERVDGLIVSNTTVSREGLQSAARGEAGGLSGAPLFERSTRVLADMYKRTGGKLTLIGAGGVGSGAEAYAKIRAGASAVQLYTALAYEGPPLVARVKRELAELLAADGFESVEQAVGADHWQRPTRPR